MALRTQNWPRLLEAIAALPSKENQSPQWNYWRAHALAATGQQQEAQTEFTLLALERHYYGFLAADRLALPYNLNHVATAIAAEVQAQVAAQPGIVRARELFQLGLLPEARREWQAAIPRLNRAQQGQAAMLALQWGWYDRAVLTANQAGLSDDLDLRFPTPYRDRVERYSRMHRLDPHVTYAIVRQESAFRPDATSPVGALGLMQMMPQTGRQVAKRLSVEPPSRSGLLDVDTNLKFGSAYLRAMLDQYNGNLVLAAAAYNAGPRRVADWLERNADLPPTVWIEAISFYETREYVKSILAFAAVFNWRLNGESGRLSEYLLPFGREPGCTAATTVSCR
jgi:soluble lytic murein transglycosylase